MNPSNVIRTSHRLSFREERNDLTSLFATAELSKNFKNDTMIVKNIISWTGHAAMYVALALGFLLSATLIYAAHAPEVTGSIRNAAETVVTTAPIGTSVHNVASVASTTGATPTGTVNFAVYGNAVCGGAASNQSGVALVNGFATSSATVVGSSGVSYRVGYSGDVNNIAATSTCMSVTATSNSVAISTTLSTTTPVLVGSSIHSSSALSNATASASGTVAYVIYTDASCAIPLQGAGVRTVTNGVVPNSDTVQFNTPGTFRWQAVYSGDTNNSAATSSCASSVLTVNAAATTTTARLIVDKVTIPSADAASFSFTTTGSGYAAFSLTDAAAPNNQLVIPGTYSVTETALSGWTQTSATCSKNGASSTPYVAGSALTLVATDTVACVFTNTKTATTTPGTAVLSGIVYSDINKNDTKDVGEPGLAGFTINLYMGAGWWGKMGKSPIKTTVSDANGLYSFTGLADGVYSIEEINQPTWKQVTSDFKSITISGGVSQSGFDFGNIQKSNSGPVICVPRDDDDDHGNHYGRGTTTYNGGGPKKSEDDNSWNKRNDSVQTSNWTENVESSNKSEDDNSWNKRNDSGQGSSASDNKGRSNKSENNSSSRGKKGR
jgi:SdrD B-like domain